MKDVVIYGAGAMARTIAPAIKRHFRGVVADFGKGGAPAPILGVSATHRDLLRETFPPDRTLMLIAIGYQHGTGGMNVKRFELFASLTEIGYEFARTAPAHLFDSSAGVVIGDGAVILDGCIAHAGVSISENVFIGSNVTLGHDVKVEHHAWINSGVTLDGGAVVGRRCVVGSGAVIGAGVRLGERTLVGPGAVVLQDTAPGSVWLAPAATEHRFSSSTMMSIIQERA